MVEHKVSGRIHRVIDGDSLKVEFQLPFNLKHTSDVRLLGVDTAEVYGVSHDSQEYQRGMKHQEFVESWIDERDDGEFPFEFSIYGDGKYGRVLVEVWSGSDCLNEDLLDSFDVDYE